LGPSSIDVHMIVDSF